MSRERRSRVFASDNRCVMKSQPRWGVSEWEGEKSVANFRLGDDMIDRIGINAHWWDGRSFIKLLDNGRELRVSG